MSREQEIAFWLDAAERKDKQGNTAAGITFRNLAWLLENQGTWLESNSTAGSGQKRE